MFFQRGGFGCGFLCAVAWMGLCGVGSAAVSAWDAAVAARARFEAESAGTHTKVEYGQVMDRFRAIYHQNPADAHAARAVEQVAELLVEQGTELGDKKSLKDGAAQYEFLAKAYPAYAAAERRRLAAAALGGDAVVKGQAAVVAPAARDTGISPPLPREAATSGRGDRMGVVKEKTDTTDPTMAVVTGIRHWSTPTYTRVAIDLSEAGEGEVTYEAARVEGPDRLFFDLHHAKLGPGLAGKSFSVPGDGFLTKIRAAKTGEDVTRVVLDVKQIGEYSAFLLPNPLRLIIDIHGKEQAESREKRVESSAADEVVTTDVPVKAAGLSVPAAEKTASSRDDRGMGKDGVASDRENRVEETQADVTSHATAAPAPVVRAGTSGRAAVSSLPPMPVTDGSAEFGLPAKGAGPTAATAVAPPRVVISAKPTAAKPAPNTVTKSSTNSTSEVAAVSEQPGKVEATAKPTTQPVRADSGASGEHYVPRSKRKAVAAPAVDGASVPVARVSGEPVAAAPPTADGETLVRALGLKIGRIVIDAGHGGHDSGTLGVGGIQEKDVVLDVALRLGKLLHDRLGAEIVYTRADDTFIPLETRTAIANKAQADLFISVHANSSQEPSARGVEVYYLNFTSDAEAMTVASRENAVSTQSVHELSDLVKKIALKDKIEESKELAGDVDASLYAGLAKGNEGLKDRGVKKAPFVVLIGANMPSILAEISFVTNAEDAEQLQTPEYRERVAESLYGGVAKYAAGVNGFGTKKKVKVERAAR